MKHIFLVICICLLGSSIAFSQQVYNSSGHTGYHRKTKKKKGYDPDKLILGTGFTAYLSNSESQIGISPIVGYRFTDRFSAGIGIGYLYLQAIDLNFSTQYQNYFDYEHIVTPSLWSKFFVYHNFYIAGAFEYNLLFLKAPTFDYAGNTVQKSLAQSVSGLLLGPGFKEPLGGRFSATAEILFDLLPQPVYSPYGQQPFTFKIGFCVGL